LFAPSRGNILKFSRYGLRAIAGSNLFATRWDVLRSFVQQLHSSFQGSTQSGTLMLLLPLHSLPAYSSRSTIPNYLVEFANLKKPSATI
jgi:hypothetical protein